MYLPNVRLTFGSGRSAYNQNIHLSVNQLTVCGKRCGENYYDSALAFVTCPQCVEWMGKERSMFPYLNQFGWFNVVRLSKKEIKAENEFNSERGRFWNIVKPNAWVFEYERIENS